jgi:RNA processing factor Prp31
MLCYSLSRYKLKFSPDKIDTMIVQAVCLLDDLDKELNNYIMRCREWYGWHFPELGKIVTDNIAFVKTVRIIGKCVVYWKRHSTRCTPGPGGGAGLHPPIKIKKKTFYGHDIKCFT